MKIQQLLDELSKKVYSGARVELEALTEAMTSRIPVPPVAADAVRVLSVQQRAEIDREATAFAWHDVVRSYVAHVIRECITDQGELTFMRVGFDRFVRERVHTSGFHGGNIPIAGLDVLLRNTANVLFGERFWIPLEFERDGNIYRFLSDGTMFSLMRVGHRTTLTVAKLP